MEKHTTYNIELCKGTGLIQETLLLLELYDMGVKKEDFAKRVIESNALVKSSEKRINDIIKIVFYKRFVNPIEVIFASGSNPNLSFDNAQSALSAGVEIEAKKSFENIVASPFLKKLSVFANATFIYSRVKLSSSIAANQSDNRPLQGQSPYVINGGLGFNDLKKELQINLLYNIIGKRIYAVGNNYGYQYPDWYEMPRNVVDLTFSKGLGKKLLLKGGITDLLNANTIVLQDGNQDQVFDFNKDQIIQSFRPGTVYSLSVVYSFDRNK